ANETLARQILICAVVVRILPAIMPAEQHLTRPTSVNIDDGGLAAIAAGAVRGLEELSVCLDPIARSKRNQFRCDQLCSWKVCRQAICANGSSCSARYRNYRGSRRALRSGDKGRDVFGVPRDPCTPLDAVTGRE